MAGQFINAPSPSRREARNFENELDIVIVGNKSDKNVTSGQYVTVRDSSISGITNGIYKATANVAAGTAFVAANLDAVTSGALNDLNGNLASLGTRVNGKVTKYAYGANSSNKFVISDFTDSYDDLFVFGVGAYNWVYCAVWHLSPSAVAVSALVNTNTVISSVSRAADGTITASATNPYGSLCIISSAR